VSPYGPLFTLLSFAFAPLGIRLDLYAMKAVALAAVLACTWLVCRIGDEHGVERRRALVFFAFNPILIVYALGGAHNDLLLMAIVLAGMLEVLRGRSRGGALMALALGVKITAGLYLPFAWIAARDRMRFSIWAAGGLIGTLLVGLLTFGGAAISGVASQIEYQQKLVATGSLPMQLSLLFGQQQLSGVIRTLALIGFVSAVAAALVYAYRTGRWVAAAGWAALAMIASSAWLTPWYLLWSLPLAAAAGSRKLSIAAAVATGYLVAVYAMLPYYATIVR
jgi:alpha-1,6-mannosyltransferase